MNISEFRLLLAAISASRHEEAMEQIARRHYVHLGYQQRDGLCSIFVALDPGGIRSIWEVPLSDLDSDEARVTHLTQAELEKSLVDMGVIFKDHRLREPCTIESMLAAIALATTRHYPGADR